MLSADNQVAVNSLLVMLPAEDRAEARRILEALPYPAHRLFAACKAGAIDCWQLKTALRQMKLDCDPEAVR